MTAFNCAIPWSLDVENDVSLSAKLAEVLLTVLVELVEQAFPIGQPATTQLILCLPASHTRWHKAQKSQFVHRLLPALPEASRHRHDNLWKLLCVGICTFLPSLSPKHYPLTYFRPPHKSKLHSLITSWVVQLNVYTFIVKFRLCTLNLTCNNFAFLKIENIQWQKSHLTEGK